MHRPRSFKQRVLTTLAAAALLLRIAVPVGFMPAAVAGGWYLELCPDGLPTAVMVALFGEHHAHHGKAGDTVFFHCDYGGGAAGAWLLDSSLPAWDSRPGVNPPVAIDVSLVALAQRLGFQSRAPPSGTRFTSTNT